MKHQVKIDTIALLLAVVATAILCFTLTIK